MNSKPNILILTSKTGGGHISLAESLRDLLGESYATDLVDPQPAFFHWHYRMLSRYALRLWGWEYDLSDNPRRAAAAHRSFTPLVIHPIYRLLQESRPDMVILTYAVLSHATRSAIRRTGRATPMVQLFTDPGAVHHTWLTIKDAEATLAPTRETYTQAVEAGFPPQQLHLSGWPVRRQFFAYSGPSRAELLAQLQLDPARLTLFLQGGGEGTARFAHTVESALKVSRGDSGIRMQILLAAGTNEQLIRRFSGIENLRVIPFTRQIAPYLFAADLVMGKAGPNMLFEAISLGKPFLATAYIPGQEKPNLGFIRKHELGWVALTATGQQTLLNRLLADRSLLTRSTAAVERYNQWNREAIQSIEPRLRSLLQPILNKSK